MMAAPTTAGRPARSRQRKAWGYRVTETCLGRHPWPSRFAAAHARGQRCRV